jgi:hypothetical protein
MENSERDEGHAREHHREPDDSAHEQRQHRGGLTGPGV